MGKARITRQARRELDKIWAFIAQDSNSIGTAEKVVEEIVSTIRRLGKMPGMGTRRDELADGIRSYPVGRFLIFYRAVPGGIQVVHVIHGCAKLASFFPQ